MRPRNNQERIINSLNKTIYTLDHKYKGKEGFALLSPSQSFEGSADGFIALTDVTVISINGRITNLTQLTTGEKRLVPITQLQISSGYILLINPKGIYNPTPLLDQYSGAAAAYSLRKLSSSYSGSAIRVRRSSDNAEQDIGFSGNDLDTSALTTFTGANDGFVVTWYDQSGNSNDATQATAAEQPKIVDAGVLIRENGQPAIKSATLPIPNLLRATFILSQPLTILGVIRTPLDRDQVPISSQNTILRAYRRYATSDNILIQGGINVFVASETFLQSLEFTVYNGASGLFALNGTVESSANFGTNGLDNLDLFQSNGFLTSHDTYLQEVIVYPTDQSANRSGIETNINNYYSIY